MTERTSRPAPRGASGAVAERRMIGRRVRIQRGPLVDDECRGTIRDISLTSNGYVRWVVRWDEGTPEWIGREVSPTSTVVEVVEE